MIKGMKFMIFLSVVLCLLVSGCDFLMNDDSDEPGAENLVLVNFQLLTPTPISVQDLDQYLQFMSNILAPYGVDLSPIPAFTTYDVYIYKITYRVTYKGEELLASGVIYMPLKSGPLSVISFQHGTILRDREAPSSFAGLWESASLLEIGVILASNGFLCSAADYLGYCESNEVLHPYHHAASAAQTSIYMLKAVKEFCQQAYINLLDEYFLLGYSEGGYNTLALQKEIEMNHASEFPLIASCPGAGAYDLNGTLQYYLSQPQMVCSIIPCFLLVSYNDIYGWQWDFSDIFQAPYDELLGNGLLNGDYSNDEAEAQLTTNRDALFTPTFINNFTGNGEQALKDALAENNLYEGWVPKTVTRLYHDSADTYIPPFNSETAFNHFRANGAANVEYIQLDGKNHGLGGLSWCVEALKWFDSFR